MAVDEDNDDGLGGRSRDRRAVTEANRWALPLVQLDPVELAAAPIPEAIRDEVRLGRALTATDGNPRPGVASRTPKASYRARDRQYQRIDKLVRSLDEEEIAAVDAFLADPSVAWSALDGWVDRMVQDLDPALDAWLALHPGADRQRLRALARRARAGGAARGALLRALETDLGPEAGPGGA